MKELQIKVKDQTEVSIKKKQKIERELVYTLNPYNGHKLWEINNKTLEVKKVKYSTSNNYYYGGLNKKEVEIKRGYTYVSALNKKNALKKFHSNQLGGKKIIKDPLILSY